MEKVGEQHESKIDLMAVYFFMLRPEDHRRLSGEEKNELHRKMYEKNSYFIEEELSKRNAEWMVLVGTKVIASSTMQDYPSNTRLEEIALEYNRVPFCFVKTSLTELLQEEKSFTQLQPKIRKKYPEQFVAIKDGKVVDHDVNEVKLHEKIYQKYGQQSVLIRHVDYQPQAVELPSPGIKK